MFKTFTNAFTFFLIVCYISLFGGFNMYSQLAQGKQGRNCYLLLKPQGFPGGSDGKASVCNAGDLGLIPGLGRSPGEGNGNPLQYSCLENPTESHGQRSLVGCSPWGRKESDTTEHTRSH